MIHKIKSYFSWLISLNTQRNKPTNQIQYKSPKLLSQRIWKRYFKTLRTRVINSPLSPPSLHSFYSNLSLSLSLSSWFQGLENSRKYETLFHWVSLRLRTSRVNLLQFLPPIEDKISWYIQPIRIEGIFVTVLKGAWFKSNAFWRSWKKIFI